MRSSRTVIDVLAYCLVGVGLAVGIWCGIQAWRGLATNDALMIAAIVLEIGLLVQSGVAVTRLRGADILEPVTFLAYAIGILLPLGIGFYLARIERTRWGSIILGAMAVVAAVMTLRLLQIWRSDVV